MNSCHYNDVMMSEMASQITSLTIVYSSVDLGADQRIHQRSASLAFVRGIHRWPVNPPHNAENVSAHDDVIVMWCSFLFELVNWYDMLQCHIKNVRLVFAWQHAVYLLNKNLFSGEYTALTNPIMQLYHIPQCTTLEQKCTHFCSKVVFCEIQYGAGALWVLWDWSILIDWSMKNWGRIAVSISWLRLFLASVKLFVGWSICFNERFYLWGYFFFKGELVAYLEGEEIY